VRRALEDALEYELEKAREDAHADELDEEEARARALANGGVLPFSLGGVAGEARVGWVRFMPGIDEWRVEPDRWLGKLPSWPRRKTHARAVALGQRMTRAESREEALRCQ
jgi:hypothetical protein